MLLYCVLPCLSFHPFSSGQAKENVFSPLFSSSMWLHPRVKFYPKKISFKNPFILRTHCFLFQARLYVARFGNKTLSKRRRQVLLTLWIFFSHYRSIEKERVPGWSVVLIYLRILSSSFLSFSKLRKLSRKGKCHMALYLQNIFFKENHRGENLFMHTHPCFVLVLVLLLFFALFWRNWKKFIFPGYKKEAMTSWWNINNIVLLFPSPCVVFLIHTLHYTEEKP